MKSVLSQDLHTFDEDCEDSDVDENIDEEVVHVKAVTHRRHEGDQFQQNICALCEGDGDLLICDGPCSRAFHTYCLRERNIPLPAFLCGPAPAAAAVSCSSSASTPIDAAAASSSSQPAKSSNSDEEKWLCHECSKGLFACSWCHEVSPIDDLLACSHGCCCRYHPACFTQAVEAAKPMIATAARAPARRSKKFGAHRKQRKSRSVKGSSSASAGDNEADSGGESNEPSSVSAASAASVSSLSSMEIDSSVPSVSSSSSSSSLASNSTPASSSSSSSSAGAAAAAKKTTHVRCPRHTCCVCGEGRVEFYCIRCPLAFHAKCVPPSVVRMCYEELQCLICHRHKGEPLKSPSAFMDYEELSEYFHGRSACINFFDPSVSAAAAAAASKQPAAPSVSPLALPLPPPPPPPPLAPPFLAEVVPKVSVALFDAPLNSYSFPFLSPASCAACCSLSASAAAASSPSSSSCAAAGLECVQAMDVDQVASSSSSSSCAAASACVQWRDFLPAHTRLQLLNLSSNWFTPCSSSSASSPTVAADRSDSASSSLSSSACCSSAAVAAAAAPSCASRQHQSTRVAWCDTLALPTAKELHWFVKRHKQACSKDLGVAKLLSRSSSTSEGDKKRRGRPRKSKSHTAAASSDAMTPLSSPSPSLSPSVSPLLPAEVAAAAPVCMMELLVSSSSAPEVVLSIQALSNCGSCSASPSSSSPSAAAPSPSVTPSPSPSPSSSETPLSAPVTPSLSQDRISAVSSMDPLFFKTHWQLPAEQQRVPFSLSSKLRTSMEKCLTKIRTQQDKEVTKKQRIANGAEPAPFRRIAKNVYLVRQPSRRDREEDESSCCCTAQECCSDSSRCINRCAQIECSKTCPCGDACQNRRFQLRQYPKLVLFKTKDRGFGIKSGEPIKKHQLVIEYCGEVIDVETCRLRSLEAERKGQTNFYFLQMSSSLVVDATEKGNFARFLNHSCNPNCITEKWEVDGKECVGIFAKRNIKQGEELTYDYNFAGFGKPAKCMCGASNCSGFLGVRPTRPEFDTDEEVDEDEKEEEKRTAKAVKHSASASKSKLSKASSLSSTIKSRTKEGERNRKQREAESEAKSAHAPSVLGKRSFGEYASPCPDPTLIPLQAASLAGPSADECVHADKKLRIDGVGSSLP